MLGENIKNIYKEFDFVKKMIFTHEDKLKFIVEVFFWICKDSLNDYKVRHLCHFAGKYRGAAHYKCNLQFEKPKFSPIIFTTGLVMNLIYSLRIVIKLKEISIPFTIMRKCTSASPKISLLALSSIKKV